MSISIDSAMGLYNTYGATGTNTTADKLSDTLSSDLSTATDDELMDVCKEFESYFLEQVFKSMQKTVPEHEYSSSSSKSQMEYYQEELISHYASTASENGEGLGLAQMLFEQMKRNYDV